MRFEGRPAVGKIQVQSLTWKKICLRHVELVMVTRLKAVAYSDTDPLAVSTVSLNKNSLFHLSS